MITDKNIIIAFSIIEFIGDDLSKYNITHVTIEIETEGEYCESLKCCSNKHKHEERHISKHKHCNHNHHKFGGEL